MIINILQKIDFFLWNGFLVYLLLIVGIFLTVRLKGIQFRYLILSLKYAFKRHSSEHEGDISQFQSLMTSLAATIGIGSIAGMATAITAGGFGAIFWMWVVSIIGMATKYSEALLAVKYREQDASNQMKGGPMYYIKNGLNMKKLAFFFALFGVLASLGGGNLIQAQSISDAIFELFGTSKYFTAIILAFISFISIIRGIKSLGKINSFLVPFMALLYVISGLIIIVLKYNLIIPGIILIVKSAFNFRAASGGVLGFSFMSAIQMGLARGISSNEAGLGSAPIASAAAKTDYPSRQALISMSSVFLSSFVVCTITVLVIAVTNVYGIRLINGDLLNGAPLVMHAFENVLPFGKYIVAIGVCLFGFSTILGWSYYGEKCFEFIFNGKNNYAFRLLFILTVFLGSISNIQIVWPLADITNGLMAACNLIGLFLLSSVVLKETKIFFLRKTANKTFDF
ncbi:MAG: sodium:alanine symporter family protein [Parachlamydiales bacterium]|nr:sodium:alanine symporter family protein [Parachlamydiales bacterium]